jgi:dCTP deaminase
MLLSDRDIRAEIAAGRLGIDPFDDTLIQPSSVDSCDDR